MTEKKKTAASVTNDVLAAEYDGAIDLIRNVRNASSLVATEGVHYWARAATGIDADFFCAAEHPKFGWYCLLGDAAGHGLPSAVFSLHLPMLFRESVLMGMSLNAIYERIHQFLVNQQVIRYYVCGILVRVRGREIEVINAGMPDVLLLASDGRLSDAFPSSHMPFGIEQVIGERESLPRRYRLAMGDRAALLLYSDGLYELGLFDGSAMGRDGLLSVARGGIDTLFDRLVRHVEAIDAAAHDDVSFAVVSLPIHKLLDEDFRAAISRSREDKSAPSQVMSLAAALRIVENFERGLILTDAEQRILYANPAFAAITGYSTDEVIGQTPRILNSGRHSHEFYREMWQALSEQGRWGGEIWNRRKDGTIYLEWLNLQSILDDVGQVTNFLATFTVMPHKHDQDERLRFLALHDPLTSLANRILLVDRGSQALCRVDRSERSLAVMFIDLDRFKTINDSLGHDIGDEVLVSVANRMKAVLREDDTLARFGGDEFVCLLPDIADRHDAAMVANKLLSALSKPVDVAGHFFKVSASIGISAYPSDCRTFDELVVQADRAMLRAKQTGGNTYKFFSAEMAAVAERQLEMEARLDAAICAGELILYYQPKFDLHECRIVGAEALVRWRDPHQGLVPPGQFIPVAERSDLIAKIGAWVMREACGMLDRCGKRLPEDFHVAVNVSPIQFERCDLAGEVARILFETGVSPLNLHIEITESMLIRDAEGTADALQRVTDMGVSVSLDDFGTGYSNLGTLGRLPFRAFKLDQSFVRDLNRDSTKSSIARSVWHLADGLSKEVVAEGVETCDECRALMGMGYRYAQGYRYGRPMPESDFMNFMEAQGGNICHCHACVLEATPISSSSN